MNPERASLIPSPTTSVATRGTMTLSCDLRSMHGDDDDDARHKSTKRNPEYALGLIILSVLLLLALAGLGVARGSSRARLGDAAQGGNLDDDRWKDVDYKVSCDTADYKQVHNKTTMSDEDREILQDVTYVSGFWRLRSGHRDPQEYINGLKETPCETAGFALNIVFVEDSVKMCRFMKDLYHEGAKYQGKYKYGRGKVTCIVMDPNNWGFQIGAHATLCDGEFSNIWYNKINVVNEVAKKIARGEISEDFKASHYFWLDGDIAHGIVGKIGRFPRLEPVLRVLREEAHENKLLVRCYNSDTKESWAYGAAEASLGLPESQSKFCPWMRHEVIANVFGGSSAALDNFVQVWPEYINKHVPTQENQGRPHAGDHVCDCPSEEFLMTSMANDNSYKRYFSSNTCARNLRTPL